MAKGLLAAFIILANIATQALAQEKTPNCGPFQVIDSNLTKSGFVLAYMSADDEFKIGTRFYINSEQKAIAVLMIEINDPGPSPKACIATIQGNLYTNKDALEHLHRSLIGEKA